MSKLLVSAAACALSWMALLNPVQAIDLNGPCATDASACNKVFVKKGGAISFQPDSDQYGGGFIMEGNKVRGQMQTCTIRSRREDGNVIHMPAACAAAIMTSNI